MGRPAREEAQGGHLFLRSTPVAVRPHQFVLKLGLTLVCLDFIDLPFPCSSCPTNRTLEKVVRRANTRGPAMSGRTVRLPKNYRRQRTSEALKVQTRSSFEVLNPSRTY